MTNRAIAALAMLAIFAAVVGFQVTQRASAQSPAKKPIDFALKNTAGKTVKLFDYRGKVVVVDVWATWCPYCVEEIPGLVSLQADALKNKTPLQLIGISVDDDRDAVKDFIKKQPMNYPVVYADSAQMKPFGDIDAYPTKFIINKDGEIVDKIIGALSRKELEDTLAKYLN